VVPVFAASSPLTAPASVAAVPRVTTSRSAASTAAAASASSAAAPGSAPSERQRTTGSRPRCASAA